MELKEFLTRGQSLRILDISQPITSKTACFPGDVPFSKNLTCTFEQSNVINLTALTMSPHVGTHADSPIHIHGNMDDGDGMAGQMPLEPFIGPCTVIDLEGHSGPINAEDVDGKVPHAVAPRVLFRTAKNIRVDVFEESYPSFTPGLVEYMAMLGVQLMGIDTPSVDAVDAKILATHQQLIKRQMYWLENLDLTQVEAGNYFLVALPLKFMELEASPVRAILLKNAEEI